MRKILDTMFANKKLAILIPLLSAAAMYLLFLLFGMSDEKQIYFSERRFYLRCGFSGAFLLFLFRLKTPPTPSGF